MKTEKVITHEDAQRILDGMGCDNLRHKAAMKWGWAWHIVTRQSVGVEPYQMDEIARDPLSPSQFELLRKLFPDFFEQEDDPSSWKVGDIIKSRTKEKYWQFIERRSGGYVAAYAPTGRRANILETCLRKATPEEAAKFFPAEGVLCLVIDKNWPPYAWNFRKSDGEGSFLSGIDEVFEAEEWDHWRFWDPQNLPEGLK